MSQRRRRRSALVVFESFAIVQSPTPFDALFRFRLLILLVISAVAVQEYLIERFDDVVGHDRLALKVKVFVHRRGLFFHHDYAYLRLARHLFLSQVSTTHHVFTRDRVEVRQLRGQTKFCDLNGFDLFQLECFFRDLCYKINVFLLKI